MRFSKLALTLFATLAASASTSTSYAPLDAVVDFDQWSQSDLHQFLSDLDVKVDPSSNRETLVDQAKAHWNSFTQPYQAWSVDELRAYLDRKGIKYKSEKNANKARDELVNAVKRVYPSMNELRVDNKKDQVANDVESTYDKVSNWIFDTWSTSELSDFVKHSKDDSIKTVATTRKDLQKQAQQIYDNKVKKTSNYGQNYYPGKWIFDSWSDQSLRSWLERNHVTLNNVKKQGRAAQQQALNALNHDKLVSEVCRNARNVESRLEDTRNTFLSSVDIAGDKIYSKTGEIKDSVFKTWSQSQLADWLNSHNLLETPNVPSKDKLVKIAKQNSYLLQNDINRYLATAQKYTSPILEKANDATQNVVDYTYNLWDSVKLENLVGKLKKDVPSWLQDRSDDASSIASSASVDVTNAASHAAESTKNQVSLFMQHLFDFWSTAELTSWLEAQGQNIQSMASDVSSKASETSSQASKSAVQHRDQLVKAASSYLSSANDFSQEQYDALVKSLEKTWKSVSATAFDSWNDADLQAWIEKNAQNLPSKDQIMKNAKATHKDLVKTARQVYVEMQRNGRYAANKVSNQAQYAAKQAENVADKVSNQAQYAAKQAGNAADQAGSSAKGWKKVVDEKVYGKPPTLSEYIKSNVEYAWRWANSKFAQILPRGVNTDL